jgi:hypothetical protein
MEANILRVRERYAKLEAVQEASTKVKPVFANYRPAFGWVRCGECRFRTGEACQLVRGAITEHDVCDLFAAEVESGVQGALAGDPRVYQPREQREQYARPFDESKIKRGNPKTGNKGQFAPKGAGAMTGGESDVEKPDWTAEDLRRRILTEEIEGLDDEVLDFLRKNHHDAGTRQRAKKAMKGRGVPVVGPGKIEGASQAKPKGRVYRDPRQTVAETDNEEADQVRDALTEAGATRNAQSESGSEYFTMPSGRQVRVSNHAPNAATTNWMEQNGVAGIILGSGEASAALSQLLDSESPQQQPQQQQPAAALFSPEEMALPEKKNTPHQTVEQAFQSAGQNLPSYKAILNMGQGMSVDLGAAVAQPASEEEFKAAITASMNDPRPLILLAPIKGQKRATEKVTDKYGGDWGRLQDLVRGTIAVSTFEELPAVVESMRKHLSKQGWKLATRPEDNFQKPLPGGYRDMHVAFEAPDGHIAELQIHLKSMLHAKEVGGGHQVYEGWRGLREPIEARKKQGGPGPSPEEQAQLDEYERQSHAIYDPVWQQAQQQQKGS